jgi:[protein-PII] uridylyltransferase
VVLGEQPADVEAWFAGIPDRTVAALPPRILAAHRQLARARGDRAVAIEVSQRRGISELLVVAPDAPGLLAMITGVLLAHRLDIVSAQIHSRLAPGEPGVALDVFVVRDRAGRPLPAEDARWKAVEADLARVVTGEESVAALLQRRRERGGLPRRVTPEVPTEIEIDNEASDGYTVIDVYTQDRPGVLYSITRTLSELGLDIGLSKVATEADRVADVFYVRERLGEKVYAPERLEEIAARLREALLAAA